MISAPVTDRVGTTTKATGSEPRDASCAATWANSGQPKARVFPEPVSATASTSQPHKAAGTVNACTAVGRSRPARAAPFNNQLALGAENLAAKDGAGLTEPPLGAVADPATAGASF